MLRSRSAREIRSGPRAGALGLGTRALPARVGRVTRSVLFQTTCPAYTGRQGRVGLRAEDTGGGDPP
jgi:hypothetical protein